MPPGTISMGNKFTSLPSPCRSKFDILVIDPDHCEGSGRGRGGFYPTCAITVQVYRVGVSTPSLDNRRVYHPHTRLPNPYVEEGQSPLSTGTSAGTPLVNTHTLQLPIMISPTRFNMLIRIDVQWLSKTVTLSKLILSKSIIIWFCFGRWRLNNVAW